MTAVVGMSSHYHDSACCVVVDGELVAAAEEERFTRRKHERRLPWMALRFCLEQARLEIHDVDLLGYYEDATLKAERQIWTTLQHGAARLNLLLAVDPTKALREIREVAGYEGPIEIFEHHESHAASAFFHSGFQSAAIVTADGVGEWACSSVGRGAGSTIEMLDHVEFPNSLGLFYSAITAYLGFEVNEGEYKVMGLAAFGEPKFVPHLRKVLELGSAGQFVLRQEYMGFVGGAAMFSEAVCVLLGRRARDRGSAPDQHAADVARSAQVLLEEAMLAQARHALELSRERDLCLAGGVALNCVANARIAAESGCRRLFIQPAASDAGGAVGAAALAYAKLAAGKVRCARLSHVFLGPEFGVDSILALLVDAGIRHHRFADRAELNTLVAERL